jgi:hypothetical protein
LVEKVKSREVLDAQCAKLKAKMEGVVRKPPGTADTMIEPKYDLKAAAKIFGVSTWTIRRWFKEEKGVIRTGNGPERHPFVIPESVLMRVYRQRAV